MLRYLLPSGAIVAICVAIYATSLKVPLTERQLSVVPVVRETPTAQSQLPVVPKYPRAPVPAPTSPQPERPVVPESQRMPAPASPDRSRGLESSPAPAPAQPERSVVPEFQRTPAPARPVPAQPAVPAQNSHPPSRTVIAQAPLGANRRPNREYSASVSNPGPPSIHELLQSAQAALAGNNAPLVRGLLESAETAAVFQPGGSRQDGTSVAAARITQALRELNNGNRTLASQYVGQALAAVGPRP